MRIRKLLSLMLVMTLFITTAFQTTINASATLIPFVSAELVLEGYTEEQLKNFPLRTVLDNSVCIADDGSTYTIGETYYPDQKIIWTRFAEKSGYLIDNIRFDDYQCIDIDASVYMWKEVYLFNNSDRFDFFVDVIIGSGYQLDPDNIRYRIHTTVIMNEEKLTFNHNDMQIWLQNENGERRQAITNIQRNLMVPLASITNPDGSESDSLMNIMRISILDRDNEEVYLGINQSYKNSIAGEAADKLEVEIYNDVVCSPENKVTDILLSDLNSHNTGIKTTGEFNSYYEHGLELVFCYYIDGTFVDSEYWSIDIQDVYLQGGFDILDINGNIAGADDWEYNTNIISKNEGIYYFKLYNGYSKNSEYYLKQLYLGNIDDFYPKTTNIIKIVEGAYHNTEDIISLPDIKDSLYNGTYLTSFADDKITFTVCYECPYIDDIDHVEKKYELLHRIKINIQEGTDEAPADLNRDTGLEIKSIRTDEIDNPNTFFVENTYKMPMDSYIWYGYQTIFVSDDIDMSKLYLSAEIDPLANVYDATKSQRVDFTQPQNFSSGKVQYTVSSGNMTNNYFVSIVKKQNGGAKLYVNSPHKRHIYSFDDSHEILIANIGDEKLTGLKVEWSKEPQNVKLHNYWTIGGDNNDTLAPMTDASKTDYLAKIKLIPMENEGRYVEVSGQLKISADGQEPVYIDISGSWGAPTFTTKSPLPSGVKFVPYSAIIATNTYFTWDMEYNITGELPSGISFNKKTGELYGVPVETGIFNFSIFVTSLSGDFDDLKKDFTLEILENTDTNVYNASDENYEIKTPIGTEENTNYYVLTEYNTDLDFISYGEWADFEKLWLNGKELVEGTDYVTKEGSTVITIKSQVFTKLTKNEQNTIAAEFRIGDDDVEVKELKRTAQNFVIKDKGGNSGGGNGNSSGGNNNEGGSNSGGNSSNSSGNTDKDDASGNEKDTSVDNVVDLIDKLPDNVTVDDEKAVEDAREAYDKLTDEQKKHVTNYGDLLDAEKKLREALENEDDEIGADELEADDAAETEEGITLSGKILDKSGNALSNVEIKIHSVVQKTTADKNGNYKLESVEFGKHSITIKDSVGNSATKTFEISLGNKTFFGENVIVAADGASVILDIEFDGNTIKFINGSSDEADVAEEDNSYDYDNDNPNTSAENLLVVAVAAGALACVSSVSVKRGRKKK